MSCGLEQVFTSSFNNAEDVQNRFMSTLIAFKHVSFKEVQEVLESMQRRLNHEVKDLSSQNESFKNEFDLLNSKEICLEDDLRKCRMSRGECVMTKRQGIAKDVYDVMEKVGRGGGETSSKEILVELRRNDELDGDKRELESWLWIWGKKYKDLDQRVSQLERDFNTEK